MGNIIGIDLGFTGAISVITDAGQFIEVIDMPVIKNEKISINRKSGKTTKQIKRIFDVATYCEILKNKNTEYSTFVIEKPGAMPSVMIRGKIFASPQGNWSLGYFYGLTIGIITSCKYRHVIVAPHTWQNTFGISKSKGDTGVQSYEQAKRLFPSAELTGPRGGIKDGRCDALMIGEYGRKYMSIIKNTEDDYAPED